MPGAVSSFTDLETAERAVALALRAQAPEVRAWGSGTDEWLTLSAELPAGVDWGLVLDQQGEQVPPDRVQVRLRRAGGTGRVVNAFLEGKGGAAAGRDEFFAVQQVMGHVGEDWRYEFPDPYAAAEDWFAHTSEGTVRRLVDELDALLASVPDPEARFRLLPSQFAFEAPGDLDAWLTAVRRRAVDVLAGGAGRPLADPPRA